VAGVAPRFLPLRRDGSFLPDFAAAESAAAARSCKALLLNYPNNPTSAVADYGFWAEALAFCEEHDLL
jgi:aspartate/methionine/tyrosine aminotransferase